MVYKQFINYPSFTIFDNIASPLKVAGMPRDKIKKRVMEVAKVLHLTEMLHRMPAELSGGQQQRWPLQGPLSRMPSCCCWTNPL
jgi:glycerol transport system ATP-binding protein